MSAIHQRVFLAAARHALRTRGVTRPQPVRSQPAVYSTGYQSSSPNRKQEGPGHSAQVGERVRLARARVELLHDRVLAVHRYGGRDVTGEPRDEKGRWTTGGAAPAKEKSDLDRAREDASSSTSLHPTIPSSVEAPSSRSAPTTNPELIPAQKQALWERRKGLQRLQFTIQNFQRDLRSPHLSAPARANIERAIAECRRDLVRGIMEVNGQVPRGNIALGDDPIARMALMQKLHAAIEKAIRSGQLSEDVVAKLNELRQPENLAMMATFMAAYAGAHVSPLAPVMPVADAYFLGSGAAELGNALFQTYLDLDSATTPQELDDASKSLSKVLSGPIVDALMKVVVGGVGRGAAKFNKHYEVKPKFSKSTLGMNLGNVGITIKKRQKPQIQESRPHGKLNSLQAKDTDTQAAVPTPNSGSPKIGGGGRRDGTSSPSNSPRPNVEPPPPSGRIKVQPSATARQSADSGPLQSTSPAISHKRKNAIKEARKRARLSPTEEQPYVNKVRDPLTSAVISKRLRNRKTLRSIDGDDIATSEVASASRKRVGKSAVAMAGGKNSGDRPKKPRPKSQQSFPKVGSRGGQVKSTGSSKLGKRKNLSSTNAPTKNTTSDIPKRPVYNKSQFPSPRKSVDHTPPAADVPVKIPKVGSSHPLLPVRRNKKDPTHGIFNDKKMMMSSKHGGDSFEVFDPIRDQLSEKATIALEHVEGHAAAEMVKNKLKEAVLHINYKSGPCGNCRDGVPELLKRGQKLWVVFPNGVGYFTNKRWFPL